MFDRFNRFKDHFHNPKALCPAAHVHVHVHGQVEKETYLGKSHRHVCSRCVPLAITNSQGTFFYDLRATSPGIAPPPIALSLNTIVLSARSSHRHLHLALWSSTRPGLGLGLGLGLLIFLIFLWRLLRSGVGRIGIRVWVERVIIFCEIFSFFLFAPETFATEINKSPPTVTHPPTYTRPGTPYRYGIFAYIYVYVYICFWQTFWCLFICNLVVGICIRVRIRFSQIGIESYDCRGTFAVNKAIQF